MPRIIFLVLFFVASNASAKIKVSDFEGKSFCGDDGKIRGSYQFKKDNVVDVLIGSSSNKGALVPLGKGQWKLVRNEESEKSLQVKFSLLGELLGPSVTDYKILDGESLSLKDSEMGFVFTECGK